VNPTYLDGVIDHAGIALRYVKRTTHCSFPFFGTTRSVHSNKLYHNSHSTDTEFYRESSVLRRSSVLLQWDHNLSYEVPATPNEGHGFRTLLARGFEEYPNYGSNGKVALSEEEWWYTYSNVCSACGM
jgi:hypothetical protein